MKESVTILDSKSIRNSDTSNSKGYDTAKKVSGIKLHLTTDIFGLPLAIHMTTADKAAKVGANAFYFSNLFGIKKIMLDEGCSVEFLLLFLFFSKDILQALRKIIFS